MMMETGTKLGPYEILEPIGAGGMGEVYRARDTTLDRDVAVKVLPEAFASDAERLERFEREAKLLASLNHPNIAAIYGLEKSDNTQALVMELVDGPTLADRIAEGPLPLEEALPITRQITEALAAAHERGIIHRDLKPANIKLTPDGDVKILDFGLAKALQDETQAADVSQSPTLSRGTAVGVILGTASYMSPEQAKGKRVDKRTDIWAFGCVLYEMLTAKKAFPGEDVSEALAAVIRAEPDLNSLPADTPPGIRRVLRRCLTKDTRDRLADISDARLEIAESDREDLQERFPPAIGQQPKWLVAAGVLLVALTGFAVRNLSTTSTSDDSVIRYAVTLPETDILNMTTGGLAISPDGQKLAYVATRGGVKQLFVRERDQIEAVAVQGSENAESPFFSPDGQWVAFFNGRALMKASLTGGAPLKICDAKFPSGASWGPDDTIVYASNLLGATFAVPAGGGEPTRLATSGTRFPFFLPDGESVLLSRSLGTSREVIVHDLVTGEDRMVVDGYQARIMGDYLVVARENSLWAARFDVESAELMGSAVPVNDEFNSWGFRGTSYDVAADGSLTFVPGTTAAQLTIVNPDDGSTDIAPVQEYHSIRLSPDGRKVAMDGFGPELWVYDLDMGTRISVATGAVPAWSPDGTSLVYGAQKPSGADAWDLAIKAADGTGEERILVDSEMWQWPSSWSPDGKWIAVDQNDMSQPDSSFDIGMVSPKGEVQTFLATPANEFGGMFSPDGKWIAYQSDQSGRYEVYVQPFPGPGERTPVSVRGGMSPVWSPDGSELYYRQDTAVMAAPVEAEERFSVSPPRHVVDGSYWLDPTGHVAFGVFPNGKLLMIDTGQANEIQVVLNWVEELKRLVPAGN